MTEGRSRIRTVRPTAPWDTLLLSLWGSGDLGFGKDSTNLPAAPILAWVAEAFAASLIFGFDASRTVPVPVEVRKLTPASCPYGM